MTTSNPSYSNPFTGQTVSPTVTSYESLTISANTTLQWSINGNNQNQVTANIIEVTATVASLSLIMPPATQVSQGQAILIRNIGANSFTVTNNVGGSIVTIASGIAQYIYVTDNTTVAGLWASVTFGAGTSAANASTLAGYGLTPLGVTLNQAYNVTSYFGSATIPTSVRSQLIVWNAGAGTLTLPSSANAGENWFCMFKNIGTGILTIQPSGSDLIDGNSYQQLQLTESIVIVCNGSGWNSFGYGRSNSFAYTEIALVVTGGTYTLSSAQAQNTIQVYTGTLTSNQILVVPQTVQLYAITNNTTGSYTFTVKSSASGGAPVTIPQGTSLVLICDGTNIYNAASGSASAISSLTLGNGSLSVPSLKFTGDLNTGLYLPSTANLGVVVNNTQIAQFTLAGLTITGTGTFSGGVGGGNF